MLERLHAGFGYQDIDMIGELSKNILGRSFCHSEMRRRCHHQHRAEVAERI